MSIIRKEIDLNKPLTEEQIKMLKDMETAPITFDEDCPALTDEELSHFHRVHDKKNIA